LPEHYRGNFFLCDFRGVPGVSGIRSFKVKARGASFELVEPEIFLWNILATDVDFGPDGAVYVSDWIEGWDGVGKGRIYRAVHRSGQEESGSRFVQQFLAQGPGQWQSKQLIDFLQHADRRVRQESQFELARRRDIDALEEVALKAEHQLARVHAIWGLGQIARLEAKAQTAEAQTAEGLDAEGMVALRVPRRLVDDPDVEVRAASAKVLGDVGTPDVLSPLLTALVDDHPRVRYYAAIGLGKLHNPKLTDTLFQVVDANSDRDPVLRHALVMGLAGSGNVDELLEAADNESRAVRIAAVLALRRLKSEKVAEFLGDADPWVATEAARAIHDVPISGAMADLAATAERFDLPVDHLIRALNANYRVGSPDAVKLLAKIVADANAPLPMRVESLAALAQWEQPAQRDRVLGIWRPLNARDKRPAADALREVLPEVCAPDSPVRVAGARVAAGLGLAEAAPVLTELFSNNTLAGPVRASVLHSLNALSDESLDAWVGKGLRDGTAEVRSAARSIMAQRNPKAAVRFLEDALIEGETMERQLALAALGDLRSPGARRVVADALDRLADGKLPANTQLDVLHAAQRMGDQLLLDKVDAYQSAKPGNDRLAPYRETLEGGNALRGRQIFVERAAVSCLRCHKIQGQGGAVGPELTRIGKEKDREYLLEAIVDPNRQIAKGFGSVMLATDDGRTHAGILHSETENEIQLMTSDGVIVKIDAQTVQGRREGTSAMPEDLKDHLTLFDIRDLVEFLANLK
jgi:quinoprotein glucose dehydrogenase